MFVSFFNSCLDLLTFSNIFTLGWAVFLGIVVGALPGLTAVMTLSLLVGLTYEMNTDMCMVVLLGVYVGAIYGASKSAILLGIPGTSAASATVLDGYPLAKQGEGGPTIGLATVSSFIGTLFGLAVMLTITPFLTDLALQFGSWEFFLLGIMGVIICGNLSSKSPVNGWISGFLGLLVSMIGLEGIYSFPRFSYGFVQLMGGISFVPAMIGLFGISEVVDVIYNLDKQNKLIECKGILPHYKDVLSNIRLSIQSGIIGVLIGIIPGAGEDIASWVAYDQAKRTSKHPEKFGEGSVEGIVAAETANNSAIGGALVPVLSLAIPGSATAAVMLSAMWLHGLRPGPLLALESPGFLPQVGAIIFFASFMMLFLGLFLTAPLNCVLKVPKNILMPIVVVLAVLGSYAINMRMFDIYTMLFFGILGYLMRQVDIPPAPMVLGLILGPMVDSNLRRSLGMNEGNVLSIFSKPISSILAVIIIVILLKQVKDSVDAHFLKKRAS